MNPTLDWTYETAFGYCPVCNGPLGESINTGKRTANRLLYCSTSILDKLTTPEIRNISGHFSQRFEIEIYDCPKEIRHWDSRVYRKGNIGYEVCHRKIIVEEQNVYERDTLINKWDHNQIRSSAQIAFPRVVNFDLTADKVIKKIDALLLLK